MSHYGKVYSRIWAHSQFRRWSDDVRLAALYLLTCPHRTTEGLFRLPIAFACHELGWPAERTDAAITDLEAAGFVAIDRDTDLVLICKALRWDSPNGEKSIKGAVNKLRDLPESPLRDRFLGEADRLCEPLARAIRDDLGWTRSPIEAPSKGHPEGGGGPADAPSDAPYHAPSIPPSLTPSPSPSPNPPPTRAVSQEHRAVIAHVEGVIAKADRSADGVHGVVLRAITKGYTHTHLDRLATQAATKNHPARWLGAVIDRNPAPLDTPEAVAALLAQFDQAEAEAAEAAAQRDVGRDRCTCGHTADPDHPAGKCRTCDEEA